MEGPYESDKRVMFKLKHERDCDCVVAGFRWYKESENDAIGSLLLGLYDDAGSLQHVGVCSSFTQEKRRELLAFLRPTARMRWRTTPGNPGRKTMPTVTNIACQGAKAAGAAEKIFPGSRCVPSSLSK